ncbi:MULTISPECIES: glycoside hydrolase family 15 protein [unclassified Pseudomonas]|uniref:glycoside hydrolase family 15 protein n=1 Tax=Pseudomonas TaxID=286 RepID=UPI0011A445FD|nr:MULTISPECIES: glycoside hydrolase family 15 protein [unclassified Pseudomonas]TWC24367.1 GH15 family glucan-1,4-alpha-glucosidase [Pseudomonas sp. SJZ083]TWC50602.1 GH15 family glucan-1,4-alpha-glucosidase [Pseudomonas sp. SJZ077]
MSLPIEQYAIIGDGHTAALVGRDGSIDWLCLPYFDSGACFAALLGDPEHGRWAIAPRDETTSVSRRYREGTLILETDFETASGAVRVIDCMPLLNERWDVLRIVVGLRGRVAMGMELVIRFDYGSIVPWVTQQNGALFATAGPDTLELHTPVHIRGEQMTSRADFEIGVGERVPFVLNYRPSHEPAQHAIDAESALEQTELHWQNWSGLCRFECRWQEAVQRSLLTLKALIYQPTGGIVAAPTTSLPEFPGGVRNWDYRYCWLRDATFTLNALLLAGYTDEALAWSNWLLRAVAGSPADLQILYSVTGERRLKEIEIAWLPGYHQAAPVRIGNAAAEQFQLDVYGEVMDTLHLARAAGQELQPHAWNIQCALLNYLDSHWQEPDEGIWEVRGPRRHFTHSKVMAWVAFDRGVKAVERYGLEGPVEIWRRTRDQIHAQVCEAGFDVKRKCFIQHYGSTAVDASLLLIPLVGFLPPDDPRVRSTIAAIERELVVDGLVLRYRVETATAVDGLPPGEGAFLPCSFWLADCLAVTGRQVEAEALFERLLALRNDVGLLAEELDPRSGHMLGNFPQALSHMALVNTARLLSLASVQLDESSRKRERLVTTKAMPSAPRK